MNFKDIEPILSRNGWTIECESPLEIRSEDGSFASGFAANIVIDQILKDSLDAYEFLQEDIAHVIQGFEEENQKYISCFIVVHNPELKENQVLELSANEYKFIPSDAQIMTTSSVEPITRLDEN
jgi:hypothetical protein